MKVTFKVLRKKLSAALLFKRKGKIKDSFRKAKAELTFEDTAKRISVVI